jgi:hypothetical protein
MLMIFIINYFDQDPRFRIVEKNDLNSHLELEAASGYKYMV